ncbi:uncharacterized protein LOC106878362 [Octopus bimaculoides]|uniref:uncharacterized protein LOC106878362 n=1 Tax=Octopus bimaculoides TaxID=37653 RepID=UPI0022E6B62C|nr:uncharacterized protein LOC106878362 [Octopus bimaculoides]
MSGQVNLKVSVLTVIIYSMNFLLTPTSSAAIKSENLIDIPENFKMDYSIFCNYTEFSAAFLGPGYSQYFFSKKIYEVKGSRINQFSRNELFPHCPYYVDAMVYSETTKKAYIFKGKKVCILFFFF